MKKLRLNDAMTVYHETLENGLNIYLAPDAKRHNYLAVYGVHIGASTLEFTAPSTKKMTRFPSGIAHFLEHKIFAQENGEDPFAFFAKSGTDANAATSYDSTRYYCSGTKNFKENLSYLIDFVNQPYFTDENVEKEKGIILEEYKMYKDIPDFQMEETLHENLYIEDNKRLDVLGTEKDIQSITKEQLYDCYNAFYRPDNMFIIILGNFSEIEALDVIKQKEFKTCSVPIKRKEVKEPIKPKKAEDILRANVMVPKLAIACKIDKRKFSLSDLELNLYLNLFFTLTFGPTSSFRQEAREKQLFTHMDYEWEDEYSKNTKALLVYAETTKPDYLLSAILERLQTVEIRVDEIERQKKVWIASEYRMMDYVGSMGDCIYDDLVLYHELITNRVEKIRSMNKRTLDQILKNLDLSNKTTLKVLPKEEQ